MRLGCPIGAGSRATPRTMDDPVAALLNEHPPQLLSVTELHSNIALLEDAVRACSAELESRPTTLESMPDEIHGLVFGQLRNVLDPRDAVDYSSASKGLREPVQRVGEGASKSPLLQLKEEIRRTRRRQRWASSCWCRAARRCARRSISIGTA